MRRALVVTSFAIGACLAQPTAVYAQATVHLEDIRAEELPAVVSPAMQLVQQQLQLLEPYRAANETAQAIYVLANLAVEKKDPEVWQAVVPPIIQCSIDPRSAVRNSACDGLQLLVKHAFSKLSADELTNFLDQLLVAWKCCDNTSTGQLVVLNQLNLDLDKEFEAVKKLGEQEAAAGSRAAQASSRIKELGLAHAIHLEAFRRLDEHLPKVDSKIHPGATEIVNDVVKNDARVVREITIQVYESKNADEAASSATKSLKKKLDAAKLHITVVREFLTKAYPTFCSRTVCLAGKELFHKLDKYQLVYNDVSALFEAEEAQKATNLTENQQALTDYGAATTAADQASSGEGNAVGDRLSVSDSAPYDSKATPRDRVAYPVAEQLRLKRGSTGFRPFTRDAIRPVTGATGAQAIPSTK